jgi:hypothetical protein
MYLSEEWTVRIDFRGLSDYVEGKEFSSKRKALKWTEQKIAKLEKTRYEIMKVSIKMEIEIEP